MVLLECATGQFPYAPPDKDKGWEGFFDVMVAVVELASPSAPEQFSPEFCSFISSWYTSFCVCESYEIVSAVSRPKDFVFL